MRKRITTTVTGTVAVLTPGATGTDVRSNTAAPLAVAVAGLHTATITHSVS